MDEAMSFHFLSLIVLSYCQISVWTVWGFMMGGIAGDTGIWEGHGRQHSEGQMRWISLLFSLLFFDT
jgi:hypothetical protein